MSMIRITSKRDGFRRCGVAHPATPTEYPKERFTEEELGTLLAEPMLTVETISPEPSASLPSPARGRGAGGEGGTLLKRAKGD